MEESEVEEKEGLNDLQQREDLHGGVLDLEKLEKARQNSTSKVYFAKEYEQTLKRMEDELYTYKDRCSKLEQDNSFFRRNFGVGGKTISHEMGKLITNRPRLTKELTSKPNEARELEVDLKATRRLLEERTEATSNLIQIISNSQAEIAAKREVEIELRATINKLRRRTRLAAENRGEEVPSSRNVSDPPAENHDLATQADSINTRPDNLMPLLGRSISTSSPNTTRPGRRDSSTPTEQVVTANFSYPRVTQSRSRHASLPALSSPESPRIAEHSRPTDRGYLDVINESRTTLLDLLNNMDSSSPPIFTHTENLV